MPRSIDLNMPSRLCLAVLGGAAFALGTEAYVYAGHLDALSSELGVGIAEGGLLAAAFALTYAVTAPFIASVTAHIDRKRLVVFGLVLIGIFNLAGAATPSYEALLALRIACGIAAAAVGPAASAAAAMLVPAERRGRAMAVVLAGMTLAFVLGIPLGSVIGAFGGWRATFAFAGALAIVAAVAVVIVLPRLPGGASGGLRRLTIAFDPAVARTLLLTVLGFAATFTVIAYIGPVAAHIAGLRGAAVGGLQGLIGVGSILGIIVGMRYADRPENGRMIAASFGISAIALALYSLLPLTTLTGPALLGILALAMIAGAAALFARTPMIQSRLVRLAPDQSAVLLALNGSMVFAGQGLGAAAGALATSTLGISAVGWIAAAIATVAGLFVLAQVADGPSPLAFDRSLL